jgi:Icc-related predicted phosphoesterase
MRILAVADVHGREKVINVVNEQITRYSPDLVIVCGDITQFGPPIWAEKFLNEIPIQTLALPGNCDPRGVLDSIAASKAILLHAKKEMINETVFVGLGGSNATPFGTPFELFEDEIFSALDGIMERGAILVVHAPSKGHLDRSSSGGNQGSRAISDIIKKYAPRLVVSAHIHEARGVEQKPEITYVNPGPASQGYAGIIDINDDIKVELIQG